MKRCHYFGALITFGLVLLPLKLMHDHNYFPAFVARFKAIKYKRSKCCLTSKESRDICDRPGCIFPCNSDKKEIPNDQHFRVTVEQAFLLETSGSSSLNYRQACAVESLIYRNPNLTVHLLTIDQRMDLNSKTMKTLTQYYPSLQITQIKLDDYLANTPLEQWYHCSDWKQSPFAFVHLSDAIRLLILSKYGGYYFDLDIIHLRPLTSSYRNFVVDETFDFFCNSVIHVDFNYRSLMQMAIEEFSATYEGDTFNYNGPQLIVSLLRSWCKADDNSEITPAHCFGFRVLPSHTFFPVNWYDWENFFKETLTELKWKDDVVAAHLWNKNSAKKTFNKNSNQLGVQLARSSCPRIFTIAPQQF